MQRTNFGQMACPIARSLERVGEWWSILILRDAFKGRTRFDEFQQSLGIAPNMLTRRLAALVAHDAFTSIAERITFGATDQTPAEVAALDDEALDALLLVEAADAQHAAGTCRMTAYEDPRGVVDPDGRVKGIVGLRIADASIMPFDCRANP